VQKLRWIYNLYSNVSGRPILPKPGTVLNYLTLALICIENDRLDIFDNLLKKILFDNHKNKQLHSLLIGLHERDPLLNVAKQMSYVEYLSRFYVVHWKDDEDVFRSLDKRIPYFELGAL
jgi:hypothetical protein